MLSNYLESPCQPRSNHDQDHHVIMLMCSLVQFLPLSMLAKAFRWVSITEKSHKLGFHCSVWGENTSLGRLLKVGLNFNIINQCSNHCLILFFEARSWKQFVLDTSILLEKAKVNWIFIVLSYHWGFLRKLSVLKNNIDFQLSKRKITWMCGRNNSLEDEAISQRSWKYCSWMVKFLGGCQTHTAYHWYLTFIIADSTWGVDKSIENLNLN